MKIFEGQNKLHKVKSEKLLPINLPSLIHNIKERSSHMYCWYIHELINLYIVIILNQTLN